MTSRYHVTVLAVVMAVLSLFLIGAGIFIAATSVSKPSADPQQSSPVVLDGTMQSFYQQEIHWHPCEADEITNALTAVPKNLTAYECATVQAPLDWENPSGETITLAVAVYRSGAANAPALFFNLGGPGGASTTSLVSQVRDSMGEALIEHYDIVALDPRGVGRSTPVKCLTDHEQDNFNDYGVISDDDVQQVKKQQAEGAVPTPEEEIAQTQELMRQFAEGCQKHSGNLAGYIDTVSAARDFDMVREILHQDKFNYLGYSYGTFLGATYADLFPSSVGRMILDAAVDPAAKSSEITALQMKGFDESIEHWIEDCQAAVSCPLDGDVRSGTAQLKKFLKDLEANPLETSDPQRPLTQSQALSAIIGIMYAEEAFPVLRQGLSQAMEQHDGSILLNIADLLSERQSDGTYASNAGQAIIAINSLDFVPVGEEKDWIPQTMQLRSELKIMDEFIGYEDAGLAAWPFERRTERRALKAAGAAPIIVIGQTHDPATPYVMSQNLAGQLQSGVLVTLEGWSHGAYSKTADQCIVDVVENYFLKGAVPENGLTCKG